MYLCAERGSISANGRLSSSFVISNGVKQGCILAPLVFILFYAAMLREAMRRQHLLCLLALTCSGGGCSPQKIRTPHRWELILTTILLEKKAISFSMV